MRMDGLIKSVILEGRRHRSYIAYNATYKTIYTEALDTYLSSYMLHTVRPIDDITETYAC